MNIQEAVGDVTVDQPIITPKKILLEPDKPAVESSSSEETSSVSEREKTSHPKMDLDLEDENPDGKKKNDISPSGSPDHEDTLHKDPKVT